MGRLWKEANGEAEERGKWGGCGKRQMGWLWKEANGEAEERGKWGEEMQGEGNGGKNCRYEILLMKRNSEREGEIKK